MNLVQLLAQIWPLAVSAAISPTIMIIAFALYQGHNGRQRALAFWTGAVLALLFWAAILSSFIWQAVRAISQDIEGATRAIERYGHILDLVVGVALVCVGLVRLVRHQRKKSSLVAISTTSRSRISFSSFKDGPFRRQAVFGAIMQGRDVTSVLLFLAAQKDIVTSDLADWEKFGVTVWVVAVATTCIWLVFVVPKRWTQKAGGWLTPFGEWISKNAVYVEVIVAVCIGVYLIIRALLGL